MAANGYGYSRPQDRGASIATALIAYGQQGGALFAAYRASDNPLAPSHLRWQGVSGEIIETQHNAESAYDLPQEEREAWAQIALGSASNRADAVGPNAPWLPVRLERERAFELGVRAQRARLASLTPNSPQSAPRLSASPPVNYGSAPQGAPLSSMLPRSSSTFPAYAPQGPGFHADEYSPTRLIDALPQSAPSLPEPPQNTGQWSRDDLLRGGSSAGAYGASPSQLEITVIPCVEVEMPALLTSADQQDFTRDFARDVAVHFSRAARSITQARELRGWMRGARIVLAVRMGFGPGSRPVNRAEMEHAAALLSEALARRTLPYAQLRFADFAEWNQGVELPN